jgi:hypothetical protein
MSGRLHWSNNGKQDVELRDTLQRACVERLDGNTGYLRQESNQRNEHEQPVEPSQSDSTGDAGDSGTAARNIGNRDAEHTSFPCKHCGDHIGSAGLGSKHKYTDHTTITDYIERDYADYISATSASGEDVSTRIRASDESRDFKPTNADSGDSVERRTGIPAGVTI